MLNSTVKAGNAPVLTAEQNAAVLTESRLEMGINIRGVQYGGRYNQAFFIAGMDLGIERAKGSPVDFSDVLADITASPKVERQTNFNIFCEGLVAGSIAIFEDGFEDCDYENEPPPEPFISEHMAVDGDVEKVFITLNWVDEQTKREWVEELPPMFSQGILRTGRWDTNVEDYLYTDHVFFRDYASNNLIYVWLSDREDEYPHKKPSEVMDYLHNDVLGDCIFDIRDMLMTEKNIAVFIDCLGGLSPEIHFSEKSTTELGIGIRNMTDKEIYDTLRGDKANS